MLELARVDDELLGEDRDRDRRADGAQVVDRARRTSAARTGPRSPPRHRPRRHGPARRCPRRAGDPAGRRRGALDLGDEVQARAGRTVDDPRGAGARGARPRAVRRRRRAELALRCPPRRRAAISSTTLRGGDPRAASVGRDATVTPGSPWRSCGGPGAASAPGRSARSARGARCPGRRRSSAPPARSPPPSSRRARRRAAPPPALRTTTSRRAPGSPRSTASTIRAFSSAVPPASFDVGAPPEAQLRDAGSRAARRRSGPTWYRTPRVVERQLVDAVPVDDERPLGAEAPRDLGDPRRGRRRPPTPSSWRVAPAGFVNGPRRLNAVRTPISRRVGPACRIAGWKFGREHEGEPRARASAAPADAASWSIRMPSASRTSAEPAFEVIARLPCLATGTPAAAVTSAAVVEMLNVPLPSPPVPTTSIAPAGASTADDPLAHRRRRSRRAPRRSRRACAGP